MGRPRNDGIIDEVAIARTLAGDAKVGARLTPDERDEVLRRTAARIHEESAVLAEQRTSGLRSGQNVTIGAQVVDMTWRERVSEGLGLKVRRDGRKDTCNSLRIAIERWENRVRAAA